MKKIFLFLFSHFLIITSVWSQQFTDFNNEWHTISRGFGGTSRSIIRPFDTVVVNDTLYTIFSATDVDDSTDVYINNDRLIRDDTDGKVWVRNNNIEHLLYDFNADIGDTLFQTKACPYVVLTIDSIQLNTGALRKRVGLGPTHSADEIEVERYWIEGIGNNVFGPLVPVSEDCIAGPFGTLSCYFYADEYAYPELADRCFTTSVTNVRLNAAVNLYPNPTDAMVYVETADSTVHLTDYTLFNVAGTVIQRGDVNSKQQLISIKTLASGIYFLHLQNVEGQLVTKRLIKQ